MKRIVLLGCFLIALGFIGSSQNVFNPGDPIIRYDPAKPYGSQQFPDTNKLGLQKWVSKPTIGVSLGVDVFDASSFKQYFINFNGAKMAFRIKFPKSYNNPDSADKKYPIDLFLHGGGEVGCKTNGGLYNNEKQLWLGGALHMQFVDQNKFDGFLLYPQLNVAGDCFFGWGSAAASNYSVILAIIDSMAKYVRADIDRLVIDGLSGGGYGAWRFAAIHPKRVAKIMPSASQGTVIPADRPAMVHIPVWFATGGLDPDPDTVKAKNVYTKYKELGADIRYTMFPERGHSCWYQHWREPDYIPSLNDVHKANPLVFFQRSEFCNESDVNAKLGITGGFYAYEWQRNNVTVATSINNSNVVLDPVRITNFTGNEMTVKAYGVYRVRFKRTAGSDWSDWSRKPAVIKTKTGTQTAPITVNGKHSKVLPALDGSTVAPLILPSGFINYEWYRVSDNQQMSSSQTFDAPVGVYKARYAEEFGCGTDFSPEFKVVDANGTPKPGTPTNLSASPGSETVIKLKWTDAAGETGVEIYRSTTAGGPYQFVALTAANKTTFNDSNLTKDVVYFYKIRSVSETGASDASNETTAKTLIDNTPPTAPSNLAFTESSSPTAVYLTWTASTDNQAVERYDIFVNNEKLYSVPKSGFTVTGLDSLIPYRFTVKAVDSAGNVSPASNQVTYIPDGTPAGTIPGIPSTVAAAANGYNAIKITWQDTTANETGFEIVRSLSVNGTYKPVATVAANDTAYTDSDLVAATTYYYRVRAIGVYGQSGFSPKVDAKTLAAPATPLAPAQLSGESGNNNSVSLSWTDKSTNETNFLVYRSTDSITFDLIATLPANSNAYTDYDVTALTYYYYYVAGKNAAGTGAASNTIHIRAGNNAPVINSLADIFVKVNATATNNFSVADDAGDIITVTVTNKPAFVTLQNLGNGNYSLTAAPGTNDVGSYTLTITAKDNGGKSSSKEVIISVGDKNTKSVYVNFGSNGKTAPSPWNNWLGIRAAGDVISSLKDENNTTTSISLTTVNAWSGITNLGHITGGNTGVFPDAVLASGIADSLLQVKQIKISGLNTSRQYNIVLAGSQNEGITAGADYSSGSQISSLNSRYNTDQTANLNNLTPDANGEILVTITRTGTAAFTYLNGIAIEEVDPSVPLLNPNNLYASATNRTTVKLTWSDRTNNESGYELSRATDSLFTKNVQQISLPANTTAYTNTGLTANTKYWYRVRAKSGSNYSEFSKRIKVITPETIVYVNFNTTVEGAPAPWNNLESAPMFNFTTPNLKDQSNKTTNISLTLEREFNGEFTSGANTFNNSGVVPDNVLRSDYWLDRNQLSQFKVNGLNHSKRYRVGFIGSSSPLNWYKGNYTATYAINGRKVYLNSWENSTKIVYIADVAPDQDGKLTLDFSTTPEAGYAFNAGVIIEEYNDIAVSVPDTTVIPPVDTIPTNPNPPVDTIPTNPNPPVDTIPTNPNPPVDTIPTNPNPPVDTIPTNPNPPVDTIPTNPNPPVDTIPTNPNPPVDTTGTTPVEPVDTLPKPYTKVSIYPNPLHNLFNVKFYNKETTDKIGIEIYDPMGRISFRRDYGTRPIGTTIIEITAYEANLRTGLYIMTLKVNGKIVRSEKLIKIKY